jgi:hypothetical protein
LPGISFSILARAGGFEYEFQTIWGAIVSLIQVAIFLQPAQQASGHQSVPDALPQDVRGRVISARQTVDPEGLIAASRLINGG